MLDRDHHTFTPIGVVRSPYQEKFAIPRQPGLAMVDATIQLTPLYADPAAVAGLEQFSHLWVIFVFHAVERQRIGEWRPQVRPPRLGGNEKLGVFATRSTHRPNPVGLSVVELLRIDTSGGVKLHIRGADLLDGTPVLDLKPYIPYADALPDARAGFAPSPPARLQVRWRAGALSAAQRHSAALQQIVEEVLSFDPRPAYQDDPERIYGVLLDGCNVRFRIDGESVEIVELAVDGIPR
jgi:tRNA-Thr(GGU) m(6)t(6)A37 methyltransferase TsaA